MDKSKNFLYLIEDPWDISGLPLLSIFSKSSRYRPIEVEKRALQHISLIFARKRQHEVSLKTKQTQISNKRSTFNTLWNTHNLSLQSK